MAILPPDIPDESPQEFPNDFLYSISDFIIDLKDSVMKWCKK